MSGMLPEGERFQASLGGAPQDCPAWLLESIRGVGPQIVVVRDIDYLGARVQVYNSNGLRWARVLKRKSTQAAGGIDMPNVGEIGVVVGLNGDEKAPAWLGSLNSIETDNTLERDSNFISAEDLVHRRYDKHETGSFTLLDKLGNYITRFFKKAAAETDPPKKNFEMMVEAGVLTIRHYRGDEKPSAQVTSDQNGNVAVKTFKDDGTTEASSVLVDKDGNVTISNGKDLSLSVGGLYTLTSAGLATINGGEFLAYKSALETLKAQLDDLVLKHNLHTHLYNPGPGSSTPTSPPPVPVVEPPISPTGTSNTKAG